MLIKNATIVTQNADRDVLKGDILIQGDRISAVGDIEGKADIDAAGMIAMPGLVNTHAHVGMTIFRGYGEDLPLHRWLEEKIWPLERKQTAEDAGLAARLAFCEMIRGGTTSFGEMCIHDTRHIFDAAREAGMRGIIARGVLDLGDPSKDVLKAVAPTLGYGNGMLKPSVAAHAPYTCSEELLIKSKELAREKGLKYQIHVSETRKEVFEVLKKRGKYPFEYLESIGLMDSDSIFVHGGWVTKREMSLAGDKGLNLSACPVSALKLATGGIAQLTEMDAAGVNVALGTDSVASNNSLDMFQTMKMAVLLQKHHYWKADVLPTQKALDFATINGARALGMECGSIEEGKLADIILLERGPNMAPEHDIVANLVYAAGPQNVSDVIIGGKAVMRDSELLTIDEQRAIEDAASLAEEIQRR